MLDFGFPVFCEAGWADDEGGVFVCVFCGCEGLEGFAESHFVCDEAALFLAGVVYACFLVGVEFYLECGDVDVGGCVWLGLLVLLLVVVVDVLGYGDLVVVGPFDDVV